jgi:GntR family transcriptional regulator of arabinose operon
VENNPKKKFRYFEVYEDLAKKIYEGYFPLNGLLPSEKEIGKIYSVERTTVRKSLDLLVNDGLIQKFQGVGAKVVSREKVQKAISNLKKSDTILFFLAKTSYNVDRLTQPYYTLIFFHLERELKRKGYKTIYSTISENDDIEELLKKHTYAGIIFASYGVDQRHLDYVKENKIPFVTVNNDYQNGVAIAPDNFMGGYIIGNHLIDLGHTKIGLLKGIITDASCYQRLTGFKIALSEHGLQIEDKYVATANWVADKALIETRGLLEKNRDDLPTAIFAFNDEMALSAMRVIHEMGLKVPEDISVVGFDNIAQSKYAFPQLTTINCNVEMISRTAVWILNNKISNDELDNFKITIPVNLMDRESTAHVRQ